MLNETDVRLAHVCKEAGIDKDRMVEILKASLYAAYRRDFPDAASDFCMTIDQKSGRITTWVNLTVVDKDPNNNQILLEDAKKLDITAKVGEIVKKPINHQGFSRIAAQTAKQKMLEMIRHIEKENAQANFTDRVGKVITGRVKAIRKGNVILDCDGAEGILTSKDKLYNDQFDPGEQVTALLVEINSNTSGPSLVLSRTDNNFVVELFKQEVAEVRSGAVVIKGIARDPGLRSKVAVDSTDSKIEPVGACIGQRGTRVHNIIATLGNEHIDIVKYDPDITVYAANALKPAVVDHVEEDEEGNITAYIEEDDMKVAFGRKTKNVELAGKLVGRRITLVSIPTIGKEMLEGATEDLANEIGVCKETAKLLILNGYNKGADLAGADRDTLAGIQGLDLEEVLGAIRRIGESGDQE